MEYRYATVKRNEEDFASGRVLFSAHGTTAFPVRLASELVQRGLAELRRKGRTGPCRLYDPFCGGGYLTALLGFLQPGAFSRIDGADLNEEVLPVARRNLALLTREGMEERIRQIGELAELYGKPSHRDALQSAERLKALRASAPEPEWAVHHHDSTGAEPPAGVREVDLVLTDLPYGGLVDWQGAAESPVQAFLGQLTQCLHPDGVVIVVADKGQKLAHPAYRRLQGGKIGKRQFVILERETEANRIARYWEDRFAEEGEIWNEEPSPTAQDAADWFARSGARSVLVAGAGYGRNSRVFSDRFEVDGIEVSEAAVRLGERFDPSTRFLCCSVFDPEGARDRYDAVYAYNLLHLFLSEDRKRLMERLLAWLNPGGLLYVTGFSDEDDHNGRGERLEEGTFAYKPGKYGHFFTRDELRDMAAGCEIGEERSWIEPFPTADDPGRVYRIRSLAGKKRELEAK
ncbi:methyltransferase domain-containing protein [Gorillibacterium sp. sgz500922]|uniref:methyltransferase domain-containing protein n=1 Tax=Gorillibacterium sp. sgz500922 TaxID=3446694 RepID=UPI003F66F770